MEHSKEIEMQKESTKTFTIENLIAEINNKTTGNFSQKIECYRRKYAGFKDCLIEITQIKVQT